MKRVAYAVFSCLANVLACGVRVARPATGAVQRLVRLARLRAMTAGRIPATTQFDGPTRGPTGARLDLGRHCRLGRDVYFETAEQGRIVLDDEVWLNAGCVLVSYARVSIGAKSLIGEYVSIRDANHGTALGTPIQDQPHTAAPISIGRDVWVGRGATILAGVTISDGAIVGANSVVTKDVPSLAIVAGAPAKVLRMRGEESGVTGAEET